MELPAAKTCPNMTSETSSGATAALFRTSLMTVEPRSCTGTVDKAPLKEPRTEGKTRAMERAPGAVGVPADRCFPPPRKRRPTASRTGTERSAGDAQPSNPRQAVPRVCGETADPPETYPSTPPNPSFMGAAKSFPNKRGHPVPRAQGL